MCPVETCRLLPAQVLSLPLPVTSFPPLTVPFLSGSGSTPGRKKALMMAGGRLTLTL